MFFLLQVSVLLEALFASLLKDENKDLKKKKEKALRSKSENKSPEDRDDIIKVEEEDEEEEIVKVIHSQFHQPTCCWKWVGETD